MWGPDGSQDEANRQEHVMADKAISGKLAKLRRRVSMFIVSSFIIFPPVLMPLSLLNLQDHL
jgi:hypothetical protein